MDELSAYEKAIVQISAKTAAQVAIKTIEKERKKRRAEQPDRRLQNTRLLLRNYRLFKAHSENAVFDAIQLDESVYDILDMMANRSSDTNIVQSIKDSVAKTALIVEHIKTMLQLYEVFCYQSGNPEDPRRFRVINGLWISDTPLSVGQIAEQENVAERTIYRDIDIACERIAALIFGIDGIRKNEANVKNMS